MYKYIFFILLSCGKTASKPDSSILDSKLSDSKIDDSTVNSDSNNSDSAVDSRVIDSPGCPTVRQQCGNYPQLPNLSITGDAPPGEVCFTSQDYNTLVNWENGNSSWQQCAINW